VIVNTETGEPLDVVNPSYITETFPENLLAQHLATGVPKDLDA